jgi:hypothetical protein
MQDYLLAAGFLVVIFAPAVLASFLHTRSHDGRI